MQGLRRNEELAYLLTMDLKKFLFLNDLRCILSLKVFVNVRHYVCGHVLKVFMHGFVLCGMTVMLQSLLHSTVSGNVLLSF